MGPVDIIDILKCISRMEGNPSNVVVKSPLVKVLLTVFCTLCTIRMGLSIICFKGAQVDYPNKCVLQSMNIAFIIANGADPDEMQQTTKLAFQGFPGSIQEGLDGA